MLGRWKKEYLEDQEHAFPGKGRMKPGDAELFHLKKRIADLEQEREILKKALAVFLHRPNAEVRAGRATKQGRGRGEGDDNDPQKNQVDL